MLLDFKNIAIELVLGASSLILVDSFLRWHPAPASVSLVNVTNWFSSVFVGFCAIVVVSSDNNISVFVGLCCSTSAFKNKLTNLILCYQLSISTAGTDWLVAKRCSGIGTGLVLADCFFYWLRKHKLLKLKFF